MAATSTWRSSLNSHQFCKRLKENNAKDSQKKLTSDAKELIVTTNDGDLFVWDSYAAHMVFFRLKNLLPESKEKVKRFQIYTLTKFELYTVKMTEDVFKINDILLCTDAPRFEVEGLSLNQSGSHIIVWGHVGVKVIELPRRYGKYGEFEGGKDTVSCRTIQIAERYFTSQQGIKLRHVAWHPGSHSDSHLVLLTSDNVLSIYDINDSEKPIRSIDLEENGRFEFNTSPTKMKLSLALGETAVSFDFGPPTEMKPRQRLGVTDIQEPLPVWPVYVVKGNGDVIVVYTSIRFTRMRLPVKGPLVMCPPADDNYGLDACAITCLNVTPPVVVIATGEGKLHHCLIMQSDEDNISMLSESSVNMPNNTIYEPVSDLTLYVYESVELELSLTTPELYDDQLVEDDFTCPILLVKDPCVNTRYHCCHSAGVHSVALPWVNSVQRFLHDEKNESSLGQSQECIVEHVICTRPLSSSPAAPIMGLDIVNDPTLTPTLLSLTSDLDFVALPLSTKINSLHSEPPLLLSESPGPAVTSPLRHLSREEPFDQHIAKTLLRSSSNPVLKSNPRTDLTQQECFQLLSRATQVFREEYIQKQDLARQEIETRVRILQDQKQQQQEDLQTLNQSKNILRDKAEDLSGKINQAQEKQEVLLKRLEHIMRKIQSRVPMLSDAEKHMLRELKLMKGNLDNFSKKLQQVRVKQDFQQRQTAGENRTSGSPAIQKNQMSQLREILSQEGEEIAGLMKLITQLKMDSSS